MMNTIKPQLDGVHALLGVVIAVSCFQLWYTVQGITVFFSGTPQLNEVSAFIEPTSAPISDITPDGLHPTRVIIKDIKIDLPIISVPLEDGTWFVHDKVANYAEGTSLINTETGNVGIYAHDRKDSFAPIKQLKTGNIIEIITSENSVAIYEVTASYQVPAEDVNEFYPTETATLTLITCDGILSEERYVVKATLKEIKGI